MAKANTTRNSKTSKLTKQNFGERLENKKELSILFPPCADILLATLKGCGGPVAETGSGAQLQERDKIDEFFCEYFAFEKHKTLVDKKILDQLDPKLVQCLNKHWPPAPCAPQPCVKLKGKRDYEEGLGIKRLFFGDLVWLYYMERMGIFQITGAILDDYATKGKKPISNGTDKGSLGIVYTQLNDVYAIILETMTRQMKMGLGSTIRDRNSSYLRCLGWNSELGKKMEMSSTPNKKFSHYFHLFIYHALQYYKDKRLAVAIQNTLTQNKPSVSTKITLRDTIESLKKSFDTFDYGRNYLNTLNGIIWVISSLGLIKGLRAVMGIPIEYNEPYEYIPAAFEMFTGQTSDQISHNRFLAHNDCASNGRSLLLSIEVLNFDLTGDGEELEQWLDLVEDKVEGYRTAYEALTGTDLAASAQPALPMAV